MAFEYAVNIPSTKLVTYSFSDEGEFPHFATIVTKAASEAAAAAAAAAVNATGNSTITNPNDGEVSYLNLSFLTLQAVAQTVIICLFGYFAARAKILTPDVQKQVSMLNVQIFTPCLIFSKLASSLSLSALIDIAVIPVLFVITTAISMLCAKITSRIFRFNKQESNFITAMAVFGNSNSLPVSLTVSLAYTLPSLTWPDIPDDNPDDVASRGILYLLIFQQLGQIVRWSWGYNTLLAKPTLEDSNHHYERIEGSEDDSSNDTNSGNRKQKSKCHDIEAQTTTKKDNITVTENDPGYESSSGSSSSSVAEADTGYTTRVASENALARLGSEEADAVTTPLTNNNSTPAIASTTPPSGIKSVVAFITKMRNSFLSFMNPPLWSMFIAVLVASIPAAKHELFETTGFVHHSITGAIQQVGGIAIPMILVVLGSNLAPNESTAPPSKHHKSIIFASLISRMILPSIFLLPIIALSVKYVKLSILDDPIFLLVAFILTISPPAIQLSQICQLNGVFEKEMAGVLFWGYVVLTLPSTIAIVVASLEVLQWAGTTRS